MHTHTHTIFAFIFVAISLIGCTKSENVEALDNSTAVELIEFSKQTLSFSNFDEFRSSVCDLVLMSEENRQLWFKDKVEFTSQEQAAAMVAQQLTKCKTYKQAIQLRDKYTQFIFNETSDDPDFTAYLPTSSIGYSMVCNAYGDVTIGGELLNMNDIKTYDQTWQAGVEKRHKENMTKGTSSTPNEVYCYTNSRKMWATAFRLRHHYMNGTPGDELLVLKLGAQQKICFIFCSWNEYTNGFTIQRNGYGSSYIGFTPDGAFKTLFSSGTDVKVPGGVNIVPVGLAVSGVMQASFVVYSQGVGYDNRGVLNIDNPKSANFYASNGQYVW